MEINKVVVQFNDGTLLKGRTSDFFPNKTTFHLELPNSEIKNIILEKLKAIFFVKDLTGNKDHPDDYKDVIPGGGRKIQVKFSDGELLIGYSQGYSPTRIGFFVTPADIGNNNERIFVINSSTEEVTFL
jgi:hypothetical protein